MNIDTIINKYYENIKDLPHSFNIFIENFLDDKKIDETLNKNDLKNTAIKVILNQKNKLINDEEHKELIAFISLANPMFYELEPYEKDLMIFSKINKFHFLCTDDSFDKALNIKNNLEKKGKLVYIHSIDINHYESVYSKIKGIVYGKERKKFLIDNTLGMKLISGLLYRFAIEQEISLINWQNKQIKNDKNMIVRLPATDELFYLEKPELLNYKAYEIINEFIEKYQFSEVAKIYKLLNYDEKSELYETLSEIYTTENLKSYSDFINNLKDLSIPYSDKIENSDPHLFKIYDELIEFLDIFIRNKIGSSSRYFKFSNKGSFSYETKESIYRLVLLYFLFDSYDEYVAEFLLKKYIPESINFKYHEYDSYLNPKEKYKYVLKNLKIDLDYSFYSEIIESYDPSSKFTKEINVISLEKDELKLFKNGLINIKLDIMKKDSDPKRIIEKLFSDTDKEINFETEINFREGVRKFGELYKHESAKGKRNKLRTYIDKFNKDVSKKTNGQIDKIIILDDYTKGYTIKINRQIMD